MNILISPGSQFMMMVDAFPRCASTISIRHFWMHSHFPPEDGCSHRVGDHYLHRIETLLWMQFLYPQ
jgi:hypothetical protein